MRNRISAILLCVLFTIGCVQHGPKVTNYFTEPSIDALVLSYDIADAQRHWDDEIEDEYPNAVLVIAHGLTDPATGEWYAYPTFGEPLPVREVVQNVRVTYPDRHIVLLVCNPDGLILDGVSNVSYARESVWIWPDSAVGWNIRDVMDPDVVGTFEEFYHLE